MRAVIICGGTITDYIYIRSQIKEGDFIICADGGYDHAVKMDIKADLVVGDFDSIACLPNDAACIRYPEKKDLTDTEIALEQAREKGYSDFLLIAATGSRMDHTLANILMLKDCLDRGEHAEIINENNKIMITNSKLPLHEDKGSIVSLIPLTDCYGVTTDNLEYPLWEATLHVGKGLGVSNITMGANAHISIQKGIMLVVVARD